MKKRVAIILIFLILVIFMCIPSFALTFDVQIGQVDPDDGSTLINREIDDLFVKETWKDTDGNIGSTATYIWELEEHEKLLNAGTRLCKQIKFGYGDKKTKVINGVKHTYKDKYVAKALYKPTGEWVEFQPNEVPVGTMDVGFLMAHYALIKKFQPSRVGEIPQALLDGRKMIFDDSCYTSDYKAVVLKQREDAKKYQESVANMYAEAESQNKELEEMHEYNENVVKPKKELLAWINETKNTDFKNFTDSLHKELESDTYVEKVCSKVKNVASITNGYLGISASAEKNKTMDESIKSSFRKNKCHSSVLGDGGGWITDVGLSTFSIHIILKEDKDELINKSFNFYKKYIDKLKEKGGTKHDCLVLVNHTVDTLVSRKCNEYIEEIFK